MQDLLLIRMSNHASSRLKENQRSAPRQGGGGFGGGGFAGGSSPSTQARALLDSFATPNEELWVIAKQPQDRAIPHSGEPLPGEGQLMARRIESGVQKLILVPLKHTDVHASVIGYVATVDVQQQYHNPYSERVEAVYVFPLLCRTRR